MGKFESETNWGMTDSVNFGCFVLSMCHCFHCNRVLRWFKFTLKSPYSVPIGKLQLAIWETSFWTFVLSNLDTRDLETYPRTYYGHFWFSGFD